MDLKVEYQKTASASEAYTTVKKLLTPEMIAKFKVSANLSYDENKRITASGKGFDLFFDFTDSAVEVSIKLGLLLKPLKGAILDGVEKQLKRAV